TLHYDEPDVEGYVREVAPARTFATLAEALQMQQAGMFSHLREGDTLVIGPDGPLGGPYRLPEEPARHKLLDLLGDLSLAGRPIIGRVVANQSGHAMNHELAAALVGAF
ncbi:MAG: UDP-3-O-acyl-N-acetylglucosamine deacetylase, partial [Gemmataceae bacterium]|nr:UDP-3-O-acyl-N-acetylglucosamine deacetylase [Gemmataceae bacterium]